MKKSRGMKRGRPAVVAGAVFFSLILLLQAIFFMTGSTWPPTSTGRSQSAYADDSSNQDTPQNNDGESNGFAMMVGGISKGISQVLLDFDQPDQPVTELAGNAGGGVEGALNAVSGGPGTKVAVLDSGIRWQSAQDMAETSRLCRLNEGEVPPPQGAGTWDKNGDGVFNTDDFAGDPRVADSSGNGIIDPEDLIWTFSDGKDNDNNGYTDDICGWDFFEDDNDPWDEVDDGHGTSAAAWAAGDVNQAGTQDAGPDVMILPVRIGDSSTVDINDFAQGVVFAVDSGAWVVQAAVEGINQTPLGQAAVDYAWSKGVAIIASAGEDQSSRRVFPANYERTIQVNAVTAYRNQGSAQDGGSAASYNILGGITNYGAHNLVSYPSDGGSSEAVGRTVAAAAMLYSAAEGRVRQGYIWRYPGMDTPLSACELKQLLAVTADDIDIPPDQYDIDFGGLENIIGPSQVFPATLEWDPYSGYGRVNVDQAVAAVLEGHIPPEAEIRDPRWFDLVNPGQVTLDVNGRVAAVRADTYQYTVEFAAGLDPSGDQWVTVQNSPLQYEPVEGVLATLDLGEVYRAVQEAMQARGEAAGPDRYAFTVRVRVRDDQGNWGEDRKTLYCFDDPDAYTGAPLRMGADVSASPRFADLDDDGSNELIVATGEGYVHAYNQDFSEVPGWPVHVTPLALHTGSPGFAIAKLCNEAYGSVTGTPAIGDLNHDGDLEVVAGDSEGRMYAWDKSGKLMPGFPVRSNPLYSVPDRADWWSEGALPADWFAGRFVPDKIHKLDAWNRLDKAFLSGPVLGNLDNSKDGSLEIIASCQDRHLYAWHMDGTSLEGWPVKMMDPGKAAAFNPITHICGIPDAGSVPERSKLVPAPSLGDLNGDCRLEVVCGSNEIYSAETCDVSIDSFGLPSSLSALKPLIGDVFNPASTRVYAVYNDGAAHGLAPGVKLPPEQLPSNAYLPGWPAKLVTLAPGVIADAGKGVGGPPAIADLDGDKTMEIGVTSAAGPAYLLEPDGTSHLGYDADGLPMTLECNQGGKAAQSEDWPVMCTLGGGCFADLGDSALSYIAPTMGLGRIVDTVLPASQTRSDDQLSAWNSADGDFIAPFPTRINDTLLFSTPGVADIDGDGSQEVLAGSSYCEIHAIDAAGNESRRWPKFTGGWSVTTPTVGDFDGDGNREVVTATREGWLLIWETGSKSTDPADWPEYAHDPGGTACLDSDARRPGKVVDLAAKLAVNGEGRVTVELTWSAPGDDGDQGQALIYDIRCLDQPIDDGNWNQAIALEGKPLPAISGSPQNWMVGEFVFGSPREGSNYYFALRARDEAGNLSAISNITFVSF